MSGHLNKTQLHFPCILKDTIQKSDYESLTIQINVQLGQYSVSPKILPTLRQSTKTNVNQGNDSVK